jgi:hypothetical protein
MEATVAADLRNISEEGIKETVDWLIIIETQFVVRKNTHRRYC